MELTALQEMESMNEFEKYRTQSFHYLLEQGFHIKKSNDREITYSRNSLDVTIFFDPTSYEIFALFSLPEENVSVSLEELLRYFGIIERKGIYQIPTLDKMEIGVDYISTVVNLMIEKFALNEKIILNDIHNTKEKEHVQLLSNYYLSNDLDMADQLWKNKEYQKSIELYEKHETDLSETQLMKLEYLRKHLH